MLVVACAACPIETILLKQSSIPMKVALSNQVEYAGGCLRSMS
jgi:hypothetical protein